jgi:hypothetical protein
MTVAYTTTWGMTRLDRAPWGGVSPDRVRELCVSGLVF